MSPHPLNDAQKPRELNARWILCGTLTLESALHLGAEAGDRVDMPVLRDADGRPLLPGTTLAGALRSALADHLVGYGRSKQEGGSAKLPDEVAVLFGGARGDDKGAQSPLIVFDALGQMPHGAGIEIRDGVAISPATGVAEDRKKYDYEVVPAGTTFPLRLDLLLPAPAFRDGGSASEEKVLLQYLATALDAFSSDDKAFGAKRSRGLGRVRGTWSAKRFDLGSAEGWVEWALSDHHQPFARDTEPRSAREALEAAAPGILQPGSPLTDERNRIVIDVNLRLDHDILVRSPGDDAAAPDVSHLRSGGKAILPGTSVAGALRSHALRIARLVRNGRNDAEAWIDRLFGPRFEGQRPDRERKPHASRLRVTESPLQSLDRARVQTRVAIDRFTQGVVEGALFDEQVVIGGRPELQLELRNPKEGELGLVLLVLKDLLDGRVPVGGTSSIGRGVLSGSATITWHNGSKTAPRSANVEPGKTPSGGAAADINAAIRAFHDARPMAEAEQTAQGGLR